LLLHLTGLPDADCAAAAAVFVAGVLSFRIGVSVVRGPIQGCPRSVSAVSEIQISLPSGLFLARGPQFISRPLVLQAC
jgi:hypothetical protein